MKQTYHFLGIGGIGMSALARILHEKGEKVSGFDLKGAPHLNDLGIQLTQKIPRRSIIVYSSAILKDNPDFILAKQLGFPLMHRSDLLKTLMEEKISLLVTGTHGKTSTSALLSWVLLSAGLKPTYAVGGILRNLKKNGGLGLGPYFVAEADESDGSFLNYFGDGAIITNIEKEHLNYWKTEKKIIEGFQQFISQVKDPNLLFYCSDDPILKKVKPPGIPYGKSGSLCMKTCRQEGMKMVFTATFKGTVYKQIKIPLIGKANALNALAVFGMALQLGIGEKKIRQAFLSYEGVKRRLEKIGEVGHITFYDDYAHHPTEIRVMLSALKKANKNRRLIAIFQPHRYTRTKALDFSKAFDLADLAIITDIYSGGEKPIKGINGSTFNKKLKANNTLYLSREKLLSSLSKLLVSGDVLVTVGAGDISEIGLKLMRII